jgi:hypothetical protein
MKTELPNSTTFLYVMERIVSEVESSKERECPDEGKGGRDENNTEKK